MDVANVLMLTGSGLALTVLTFFATYWLSPATLIRIYYWYWRCRLGVKVSTVDCGGYRFSYSMRGRTGQATSSLLLLHGFSAHKDMWLPLLKFLPYTLHVICVDMPGHEGTSRTGPTDYSIEGQVKRVHQFVQAIRLDRHRFHLVGTSMGGAVAGVYAARHPDHLSHLTVICPAGLETPVVSPFVKTLRELERKKKEKRRDEVAQKVQDVPLIPSTPQQMEEMVKLCTHTPYNIPRQVLQGIIDLRVPHNDFYREVFMEIVGDESRHALQKNMHLITVPLLVIWGKQDQVVDVSGGSVLQKAVPGCQVALLDSCGHTVVMERPRKTAQLIQNFMSGQIDNGKKLS